MAKGGKGRASRATPVATYLPAIVALGIILFAGLFAERQNRSLALLEQRAAVDAQIGLLGSGLQRTIEAEATMVDRLAGALAANAVTDAAAFEAMAAPLLRPFGATHVLAVVGRGKPLQFPVAADASAAIRRALRTTEGAARGATRVIHGADGDWLVVWAPVLRNGDGASHDFAASASRASAILPSAGITDTGSGLRLAVTDPRGDLVFGDPAVATNGPVVTPITLPGGDWTLAATPAGGWSVRSGALWPIRLLTLLSAALIVGPMLRTRRLVGERQRNILDLRDREAELEQLSRRLGLALTASRVGVWDYHFGTDKLVWDERMEELYGYPPFMERHTYADWRARLYPDDRTRAEDDFDEAINSTGRYESDYRLLLPGGAVRHIRAIGQVFLEPDGTSKIVGVNWDVTADVQRNAELEAKRLEAEGASVAKSQFLATMSHEIRTPMNGVIGMLDLIQRTETEPAQRERAEIAGASAHHLLSILNDILDLSKLQADRIMLERRSVDVRRLARDVVALMATGAGDRAVEVTSEIAEEVPAFVLCDATRLRQVMMNLVGNAVKFTEAGSVTLLICRGPEDRLEVAVRDTGCGIPEEARHTLFQRFSQVDASIARLHGGTGLGLAISRQIVELMGGQITVESVLGLGSTFRFWLPAPATENPDQPDAAGPAPDTAAIPPARVLVAEDNQTNRQILGAYLAMGGHTAQMVTNGVEALAALDEARFDLILMDVQMPVMDGITATRRIRALPGPAATVPIIALTANAMHGDRETCLGAGMTEYVAKPVSLEALYGAIARSLGYGAAASTGAQPSPGSNLVIASATASVSSPRSA